MPELWIVVESVTSNSAVTMAIAANVTLLTGFVCRTKSVRIRSACFWSVEPSSVRFERQNRAAPCVFVPKDPSQENRPCAYLRPISNVPIFLRKLSRIPQTEKAPTSLA